MEGEKYLMHGQFKVGLGHSGVQLATIVQFNAHLSSLKAPKNTLSM